MILSCVVYCIVLLLLVVCQYNNNHNYRYYHWLIASIVASTGSRTVHDIPAPAVPVCWYQ